MEADCALTDVVLLLWGKSLQAVIFRLTCRWKFEALNHAHIVLKRFHGYFSILIGILRLTHLGPQTFENNSLVNYACSANETHLCHNFNGTVMVNFSFLFKLVKLVDLLEIAFESLVNYTF